MILGKMVAYLKKVSTKWIFSKNLHSRGIKHIDGIREYNHLHGYPSCS